MFHRRQYAMAMGVFLQYIAHYTGLATRRSDISTFPSVFISRPTGRGVQAGGFDTDAGAVVDAGRELAERRLVQEMARRRAQTSAWRRRYPLVVLCVQSGPEPSIVFPSSTRQIRAGARVERGVAIALKG